MWDLSDGGPRRRVYWANSGRYPGELVDIGVAGEKRLQHEHFSEDAAAGPHVARRRVVFHAQQMLWCSVPASGGARR